MRKAIVSEQQKKIAVEISKVGYARHGKEYTNDRMIADLDDYIFETFGARAIEFEGHYYIDPTFREVDHTDMIFWRGNETPARKRAIRLHGLTAEIQAEIEAERLKLAGGL